LRLGGTGVVRDYWDEEKTRLKKEYFMFNGLREGPCKYYYEDGITVCSKINRISDSSEGKVFHFYKSGKLRYDIDCIKNIMHGNRVTYYENGYKHSIAKFINALLDGEYREFYDTGELYLISNYERNFLQGYATQFYKNGKPMGISYYKNGFMNGEYKTFYESGEILLIQHYKNCLPHGDAIYYDKEGNIKKKRYYVNGEIEDNPN
jgi:antitoxin component YwqK of YwqJK toxin-antitoxin module